MQYYKVREDVIKALISYLRAKPYDEVYQGIHALLTSEPIISEENPNAQKLSLEESVAPSLNTPQTEEPPAS